MVERQLPKLHTRVRFPSPAPTRRSPDTGRRAQSHRIPACGQPGRSCLRAGKRRQPRQRRSGLIWSLSNFRVTGVYRAPVSRHCLRDQSVPGKDRPPSARGEYRGVVRWRQVRCFSRSCAFLIRGPRCCRGRSSTLPQPSYWPRFPCCTALGRWLRRLTLIGFVYAFLIYVVTQVGMDGGSWLAYLSATRLRCCWSAPNGYGCASP